MQDFETIICQHVFEHRLELGFSRDVNITLEKFREKFFCPVINDRYRYPKMLLHFQQLRENDQIVGTSTHLFKNGHRIQGLSSEILPMAAKIECVISVDKIWFNRRFGVNWQIKQINIVDNQ